MVAPSAMATAMSTSTWPRSWPRRRFFVGAIASDSASVSPSVIGQVAQQAGTGVGDHALAAGGHHIAVDRALRFISEVPSWFGLLWSRNQQFPSPRGLFRVFRHVSVVSY